MSLVMRKILVNIPFLGSLLAMSGVLYYVIPSFYGILENSPLMWGMLTGINLIYFTVIAVVAFLVPRSLQRPLTMSMLIGLICMYELAWNGSFPMVAEGLAQLPSHLREGINGRALADIWLTESVEAFLWAIGGSAVYWAIYGVLSRWTNRLFEKRTEEVEK